MGDSAVANGGESRLQDDEILVFEPVVSRPDAARVVESGDALPWPVVGAPFALDGMAEVIGVFLAGSAWAVHAPPFLRIGPHPVDVPDSLVLDALAERDSAVHAFAAWQTYARELRKGASARRLYSWGWAPPVVCAGELQRLADQLLAAVDPALHDKNSPFVFHPAHRLRAHVEQVGVWTETYLLVCARWLRLVTLAARVLLHHVYLALLIYHGPPDLRYNALYRTGWADALSTLARLPADGFAGFASALADRAQLPPEVSWYLEREFEFVSARYARSALETVWGITPDIEDRLDSAGVVDPLILAPVDA